MQRTFAQSVSDVVDAAAVAAPSESRVGTRVRPPARHAASRAVAAIADSIDDRVATSVTRRRQ